MVTLCFDCNVVRNFKSRYRKNEPSLLMIRVAIKYTVVAFWSSGAIFFTYVSTSANFSLNWRWRTRGGNSSTNWRFSLQTHFANNANYKSWWRANALSNYEPCGTQCENLGICLSLWFFTWNQFLGVKKSKLVASKKCQKD